MRSPSLLELELLSVIGPQELSGREVRDRFREETGRNINYATVYAVLRRANKAGWVNFRDGNDEDGVVRYFWVSSDGLRVGLERREQSATHGGFAPCFQGS